MAPTSLRAVAVVLGFTLLLATAVPAGAETLACQRTIAKASQRYAKDRAKILRSCAHAVVVGKRPGPCPDAADATKLAKAAATLGAAIGKACGGADHVCGGDTTGEDTPPSLAWPATCPGVEGACAAPIADCGGIASCLTCIADATVDQAIGLYYDDLALPSADATLARCQTVIGKAAVKFLRAKSKVLLKCWEARLLGKHGDPCPAAKAQAAIAKAEAKKVAAICKACGGADGLCNGTGDLAPATIGVPASCPDVTVPEGDDCGSLGTIDDLSELVQCVDCVTDFEVDCLDRAQVPQLVAYPFVCLGPQPCDETNPFTCGGTCAAGLMCAVVPGPGPGGDPPVCGCVPDGSQPCEASALGYCNGTCTSGHCGSLGINGISQCGCGDPPCGEAPDPTCGGDCPAGQQCIPGTTGGLDFCICAPVGQPCSGCAPGACAPGEACSVVTCSCVPE